MGILVSFVVIAYNEAGNIGRTLDGITALAGLAQQRYEVIVVNDGSRDKTPDIVADRAARDLHIKLIDLGTNRGRGYARAAAGSLVFATSALASASSCASCDAWPVLSPIRWSAEWRASAICEAWVLMPVVRSRVA